MLHTPSVTLSPASANASERSSSQVRRNLGSSLRDGGAYGAMVGLGETYLPAFALAVGLGDVTAGLVASVPLLAGGILQLISLRAISWLGGYQRWIMFAACLQALAFIPLFIAAVSGGTSAAVLFVVASIYWAGGLAAGPAWNTWIEEVVPRPVRSKFFALRSRLCQVATLAGFLAGGACLQYSKNEDMLLWGFAAIFLMAGISRTISVIYLARHLTPTQSPGKHNSLDGSAIRNTSPRMAVISQAASQSLAGKTTSAVSASGRSLLIYLVIVQGMVQISGPYFTPYLLGKLSISYSQFVILISTSFIAKVISLATWGQFASRRGAQWLLWVGAIGIVPISTLWVFSDNFFWLIGVQALSGIVWAAYELGFFLMFFESLPAHKRARMLTLYNLANTSAWFVGAVVGGFLLSQWGSSSSAYHSIFLLSSIGRLFALALLWRVDQRFIPMANLRLRIVGLRPNAATIDAPVLPTIPELESNLEGADLFDSQPPTQPVLDIQPGFQNDLPSESFEQVESDFESDHELLTPAKVA